MRFPNVLHFALCILNYKKMKRAKATFLLLILAFLVISPVQLRLKLFKEEPLKGYYRQSEFPSLKYFTWTRWFSSDFQDQFSIRVNDNSGLRKSMIRINNQCDYSLFGIIHANGFVQGKSRYLFEEDYICLLYTSPSPRD